MEKMLITGVAADTNTARISVIGVDDQPGTAFRIFNTLAKNNINVDIILQSVGRDGTKVFHLLYPRMIWMMQSIFWRSQKKH